MMDDAKKCLVEQSMVVLGLGSDVAGPSRPWPKYAFAPNVL